MKTGEFKKVVEDSGCFIEDFKNSNCLNIHFNNHKEFKNNVVGHVHKSNNYVVINSICPKELAQAMLDYAYTPLEEREELKKYYLRFPKGYNKWYSYLAKEIDVNNGEYDCTGKFIDYTKYQNTFTQEEIDAMPFDTSFFIKEEVI